jgi:hypothetical protein
MTTTSARTRIVAVPESTFERFPRLTRWAAVANIAEALMPDSPEAAALWRLVEHEKADVGDGLMARDQVAEGYWLATYGKAIAWREVAA